MVINVNERELPEQLTSLLDSVAQDRATVIILRDGHAIAALVPSAEADAGEPTRQLETSSAEPVDLNDPAVIQRRLEAFERIRGLGESEFSDISVRKHDYIAEDLMCEADLK